MLVETVKSPIRVALLVAFPVEAVNFFYGGPFIDLAVSVHARWYTKAIALEWLVLHWPGLRLAVYIGWTKTWLEWLGALLLAASGYIETVVVIVLGIYVFRLIRRARKRQDAAKSTV